LSALAGIYCRDGSPADRGKLDRMCARLAYRGREGCQIWTGDSVGFAFLPFDTGAPESQRPGLLHSGELTIVGDVRLDNRVDLQRSLGMPPEEIAGGAEVALAIHRADSVNGIARLEGDFALAAWDKAAKTLTCVRDHLGLKPLYYFSTPRLFAFATEIKALLALEECPTEINENRVADFLVWSHADYDSTFYRGIFRLPPAHKLVVNSDSLKLFRYWSLDPSKELRLNSEREYEEQLREELFRSVRSRLVPGFTGSFLSGGLDSSSLACIAARILEEDSAETVNTFTFVFPSLQGKDLRLIDERNFVEAVLQSGRFRPNYVEGDKLNPVEDYQELIDLNDEPYMALNQFLHRAVYTRASELGLRVILDGVDGDTTISHGYQILPELLTRLHWIQLWRQARALSRHDGGKFSTRQVLWICAVLPSLPSSLAKISRSERRSAAETESKFELLNPEFMRRTQLRERLREQEAEADRLRLGTARAHHHSAMLSPLYPLAFELADKLAAQKRVEPRYPFFDRRLMEFCLAIPSNLKFRDGWGRWILRRAMEGVLPPEVQWRKQKANLEPNYLRRVEACCGEMFSELKRNAPVLEPFVRRDKLESKIESCLNPPIQNSNNVMSLMAVSALSHWLQSRKR
jgi:asparagine synthase (glutamine-hydrolysing)